MRLNNKSTRIHAICWALLIGSFIPTAGQHVARADAETSCYINECDFQNKSTVLRTSLWQSPCTDNLVNSLSSKYYDPGGGVRSPAHFVNGVCLFHRIDSQIEVNAADTVVPNSMPQLPPIERGIDELQKSQNSQMLPSQRNLALLFEGLLHCRKMDDIKDNAAFARQFCYHRSAAKASLGQVDFMDIGKVIYPDSDFSIEDHIQSMADCYDDHLDTMSGSVCLIDRMQTREEIKTLAKEITDKVIPNYFEVAGATSNRVPGFSAILKRSVMMAQSAVDGSNKSFDRLNERAGAVEQSYKSLASEFISESGETLPARVNALSAEYNEDTLLAIKLIDIIDNYINGLFIDTEKGRVNMKDVLADKIDKINNARAIFTLSPNSVHEQNSFLNKLSTIEQVINTDVTTANNKAIHRMCSLYYCDIYGTSGIRRRLFRNACNALDTNGQPLGVNNALCGLDLTNQKIVAGETTDTICRAAGFTFDTAECASN